MEIITIILIALAAILVVEFLATVGNKLINNFYYIQCYFRLTRVIRRTKTPKFKAKLIALRQESWELFIGAKIED